MTIQKTILYWIYLEFPLNINVRSLKRKDLFPPKKIKLNVRPKFLKSTSESSPDFVSVLWI